MKWKLAMNMMIAMVIVRTASRSDGDSYMSYSYYSSDELSHEDIQKMLKVFGF